MSVPILVGGLAGGVGLFLLGMWLMTDGLELAAIGFVNAGLLMLVGPRGKRGFERSSVARGQSRMRLLP